MSLIFLLSAEQEGIGAILKIFSNHRPSPGQEDADRRRSELRLTLMGCFSRTLTLATVVFHQIPVERVVFAYRVKHVPRQVQLSHGDGVDLRETAVTATAVD